MKGNSFGEWIGIHAFGESHGRAMGVVLEDIKPNVEFPIAQIEAELQRRRPGNKRFSSNRNEKDQIHILSGVLEGKTTGMPVCMVVYNEDQRSKDYQHLQDIFRPGHADWSWYQKFKIFDWRGGGRASGRETISRVAAAAAVENLLSPIAVTAYPVQIGSIKISELNFEFNNEFNWHDQHTYNKLTEELAAAAAEGDSLGGIVEITIDNVPAGLGDPVFEKLDAQLAKALISIGGVKGIEFGGGFHLAAQKGSESNDQMNANGFLSNNCGGILGGVTTGQQIILRLAVKPTSSIAKPQKTINKNYEKQTITRTGRHDVCIINRLLPVAEAMVKLVLADCISFQKLVSGQHRDINDLREAIDKIDEDILLALARRKKIVNEIGIYKSQAKIAVIDENREDKLFSSLEDKAMLMGLTDLDIRSIWQLIIASSRKQQENQKR